MNRRVLLIGVLGLAALFVVGAGYGLRSVGPQNTPERYSVATSSPGVATPTAAIASPAVAPASRTPAIPAGKYTDYNQQALAAATGTKILFFHAPWCPQCRKLEASIIAGKIPDGVTILKVDYDTNQKLRQQYGVTIQTTLVRVDDDGKLEKRYVAYESPTLTALIENMVP